MATKPTTAHQTKKQRMNVDFFEDYNDAGKCQFFLVFLEKIELDAEMNEVNVRSSSAYNSPLALLNQLPQQHQQPSANNNNNGK